MKKLKVILVGAGLRGTSYTDTMLDNKNKFEVVAVAEPIDERLENIKTKHNIADNMCFKSWEPIFEKEKFADVVLVCTMDRDHFAPAMAAIEKGYDLLLEKPVAPTPEECVKIRNAAREKGTKLLVCHVLRYTQFFKKLKEVIDSGMLGRVMSIEHDECVGNTHQSHSFVRGNWGNSERSSSMLLQKSCHDMDILQWLVGKKCTRVHSFGSTTYFTEENAPLGSPEYCIEGCPEAETCYYNAVKLYFDDKKNAWFRSAATKCYSPTDDDVLNALRTTQYGKCVFKCDNDVVDHQVVNLEFEDGTLANFNMCAFNEGGRHIRIMGTKGELIGSFDKKTLDFFSFAERKHIEIDTEAKSLGNTLVSGHGGGDGGIVGALYDYITENISDDSLSEIGISVDNHMIAFAAEKSRETGTVVNVFDYMESFA